VSARAVASYSLCILPPRGSYFSSRLVPGRLAHFPTASGHRVWENASLTKLLSTICSPAIEATRLTVCRPLRADTLCVVASQVRAPSFVAESEAKRRSVAASPELYLISRVAEGSVLAIVSQTNGTKPAAWAI
jgi:hypothetical protein